MTHFSCQCLNVSIEADALDGSDPLPMMPDDDFFSNGPTIMKFVQSSVKVPLLMLERVVGSFRIEKCINCQIDVYALINDSDVGIVALNTKKLLNDDQVNRITKGHNYSPIFKIVIPIDDLKVDKRNELDRTIGEDQIGVQVLNWLDEQNIRTEERIAEFAERQYDALELLKIRAKKEQFFLSRLINAEHPKKKITTRPAVKIVTDEKKPTNPPLAVQKKTESSNRSFDAEGLFSLDDVEEAIAEEAVKEEESDGDEEGAAMRRRDIYAGIARSLPVPVPKFAQEGQHIAEANSPEVPIDIAEGIKALAKSVHGDAIFGELPRPRFSTHL